MSQLTDEQRQRAADAAEVARIRDRHAVTQGMIEEHSLHGAPLLIHADRARLLAIAEAALLREARLAGELREARKEAEHNSQCFYSVADEALALGSQLAALSTSCRRLIRWGETAEKSRSPAGPIAAPRCICDERARRNGGEDCPVHGQDGGWSTPERPAGTNDRPP